MSINLVSFLWVLFEVKLVASPPSDGKSPMKLPMSVGQYLEWFLGVVFIITIQLHSAKSELRFCADSNPFAACQIFATVRISDSGPAWKKSLTPFVNQPFCKKNRHHRTADRLYFYLILIIKRAENFIWYI